jgi:ABC-type amino acid transport substrate-binding protein
MVKLMAGTGGLGRICPVPVITPKIQQRQNYTKMVSLFNWQSEAVLNKQRINAMRRLVFWILLLILPLSHAKALLIGTTGQNPPFNSIADQKDHFYGFDIDIMEQVCERLKIECKFTPVVFNDLFTELAANKIDLASAAIIITPNRQQQFLFSLPYLKSTAQFLVKQESPLSSPENIPNKRVGTRLGTPFADLARNLYQDKITIVEFPDIPELLNGLNNNKVDTILMDAEAAKNWVSNNDNLYKLIGTPIPIGTGYGIMANLNQTKLIAQINQILLNIEADGTYLKIYSRYFTN